jgi:Icc-related predicted phosphoesterase
MRLICISDTHSRHNEMGHPLPKGDVLIHAGDLSNKGSERDVTDFIHWYQNLQGYDTKLFIAGNHDFSFEKRLGVRHKGELDWLDNLLSEENLSQSDVTYLEDNFITIDSPEFSRPIKFYGSPWQPWFYDWAFNLPRLGTELQEKWNMIPDDTDVLITHTPPNGYGDLVNNWRQPNTHVGCECLISRVGEIKPLVNVFGHIHEGYGVEYENKTLFVNASTCTTSYEPINKPIIVDLKEVDGQIIATHVEE